MLSSTCERIIACGGEVRFHTQLVGMDIDAAGMLHGVTLEGDGVRYEVEASRLILACGHSARDTFALLKQLDFELKPKPFSIGVRIGTSRSSSNRAAGPAGGGAPCARSCRLQLGAMFENGRWVYTLSACVPVARWLRLKARKVASR